jgi:hypothetical protein
MPETIYDALRESHEIQRSLCRKLLRAKPGTQDRISLFKQLHTELAAHAAAEERFLYAPVLMHDAGLDSSRHALHEHHEMDELVEDLHKADAEGGQWLAVARKLSEKVHHHLREEEKKFFQVTGKILDRSGRSSAGGEEVPQGLRADARRNCAAEVHRRKRKRPACGAFFRCELRWLRRTDRAGRCWRRGPGRC